MVSTPSLDGRNVPVVLHPLEAVNISNAVRIGRIGFNFAVISFFLFSLLAKIVKPKPQRTEDNGCNELYPDWHYSPFLMALRVNTMPREASIT